MQATNGTKKYKEGDIMANISQNVNIEMLEKLPDGTYKRKYPKTRSDTGVTFDEHLADDTHIPSGLISMWSGLISAIPSGWVLCDGLNGTPNLLDRFIVGAGGNYAVGDTGGEENVTLSSSQIPSHRHSSGTLSTSSDGDHSHSGSSASAGSHSHTKGTLEIGSAGSHTHGSGTYSTSSAGSHSHGSGTLSTNTTGSHTHTVDIKKGTGLVYENNTFIKGVDGTTTTSSSGSHSHSISGSTASEGSHTHSVSGTSASGGSHTHSISGGTSSTGSHSHTITIGTAGSHSHTVSGYTGYIGSSGSHENRPPYYALAFIMKL